MTEAPPRKDGARRQFVEDYARIRSAEGRGSEDSAYYRALPFADLTGRNAAQWRIRARTFQYFADKIVPRSACDILDLGAGNCWLSHRLKERGHAPVAVDIFADAQDGLRARRHYPGPLPAVEAEFDHLPFPDARFDLIVFNSAIHYSADYVRTLSEARRCLRPHGCVVILDSPVYERREHGEAMRAERQQFFERQYGFRSDALGSIEYFDMETLRALAEKLSLTWEIRRPWYGWKWHLRPLRARLKKQRPPSRFWILVGRFG
jgi:SAM-dependent methyltransferase